MTHLLKIQDHLHFRFVNEQMVSCRDDLMGTTYCGEYSNSRFVNEKDVQKNQYNNSQDYFRRFQKNTEIDKENKR